MDKVMARMNAVKHRETRKRPRVRLPHYATVAEILGASNLSYVSEGDVIRVPDVYRMTAEEAALLWSPRT